MSWEQFMRFVCIAGKLVNVEQIKWVTHREDAETGRVYCLYVFDYNTTLQEVFEDCEKFEQAMKKYGILKEDEKSEEIHHLKKLCIIGKEIINKIKAKAKAGRR